MYDQHTREIATTRHRSLVSRGGRKAFVRDKDPAQKKNLSLKNPVPDHPRSRAQYRPPAPSWISAAANRQRQRDHVWFRRRTYPNFGPSPTCTPMMWGQGLKIKSSTWFAIRGLGPLTQPVFSLGFFSWFFLLQGIGPCSTGARPSVRDTEE